MSKPYKALRNKAYKQGRVIRDCDYNGARWTTNDVIAERGEVNPTVGQDTIDWRPAQRDSPPTGKYAEVMPSSIPKLHTALDTFEQSEPVVDISEALEVDGAITPIRIETDNYSARFDKAYTDYLRAKYPEAQLSVSVNTGAALLEFTDSDELVAVVMALRN